MILLTLMIRFFLFIIGIVLGFAAAIATLPLPGKTFFNRMSKLPPKARDLIDNGIDLGISFFRLAATSFREFSHRANIALEETKSKVQEIKERYQESKEETANFNIDDLQSSDEYRTEVEV